MSVEVENDAEIELLGSNAAGELMKQHEAKLDAWAAAPRGNSDSVAADVFVWTKNRSTDDRLYLTLLSNNLQHGLAPSIDCASVLKTERWRQLLLCMNGRIDDFDFITLLCPSIMQSYQEQREQLLVVPRAQFILVEICRCRQGWYDRLDWKRSRCQSMARRLFQIRPTNVFSILEAQMDSDASTTTNTTTVTRQDKDTAERKAMFDQELKRQLQLSENNLLAARRGDQLDHCLTPDEATHCLPLNSPEVEQRLRNAMEQLYHPNKDARMRFVVLDDVLSTQLSQQAYQAGLDWFDTHGGNSSDGTGHSVDTGFIAAQTVHRQDQIVFLPMFDASSHALANAMKQVSTILVQVAKAASIMASTCSSSNTAHKHLQSTSLRVPKVAQLALYDGVMKEEDGSSNNKPGYVAHLYNCGDIGGEGENYRELTAILYLNGPSPSLSDPGGALRCFDDPDPPPEHDDCPSSYHDIEPRPGRLVLFPSRHLVHSVLPVCGWRRLALSVWILHDSRSVVLQESR